MRNMENSTQTPENFLPESHFYLLADARNDDCMPLYAEHQYDPVERWGDVNPENTKIGDLVMQRYKEFDPTVACRDASEIYRHPPFPYSSDMVHPESFFDTRKPEQLDHVEEIGSKGVGGWYTVVSEQWKCAIQCVEPGVHEFFPHVLNFKNASIQRYIFRSRALVRDALVPIRATTKSRLDDMKYGLSIFERYKVHPPHIDKQSIAEYEVQSRKLAGKHWITFPHLSYVWEPERIISQPLAIKLNELLPHRMVLLPLACD
jgi:hypothetical protein